MNLGQLHFLLPCHKYGWGGLTHCLKRKARLVSLWGCTYTAVIWAQCKPQHTNILRMWGCSCRHISFCLKWCKAWLQIFRVCVLRMQIKYFFLFKNGLIYKFSIVRRLKCIIERWRFSYVVVTARQMLKKKLHDFKIVNWIILQILPSPFPSFSLNWCITFLNNALPPSALPAFYCVSLFKLLL